MAEQHAADTPEASPGTQVAPAASVMHEEVVYALQSGREFHGYLAWPAAADGALPGILMFHEWWGLNDNIRAMADRLAAQGYVVLAPDLYGARAVNTPEAARKLMSQALENRELLADRLKQAYKFLQDQTQAVSIGTIGWCFGGSMSLWEAVLHPAKVDATVIYYGDPSMFSEEQLAALQMPILGFFGAEDQGIPVSDVRTFEDFMQSQGKPVEIHVYEGAGHAFANPSGQNYRPEAAADAWNRMLEFFNRHLQVAPADMEPAR
jgi:carboxymethylenebutenolidase